MRRRLRRPRHGTVVAYLALFVALGGTALATSQTFLLGATNRVNAATAVTNVKADGSQNAIANPLLTLKNLTTTTGATALNLSVASGHAPFTTNSSTKVTNLNADKLDGLDSTAFQRRVSGACATGTAIRSISSTGTVTCQDARTNHIIGASGNLGADFSQQVTTHGGPVLVMFDGSGSRTVSQGAGPIQLDATIDQGTSTAFSAVAEVFATETASHRALIPAFVFHQLSAGTHRVTVGSDAIGQFDSNDVWHLEIVEFAH